METVFPRGCEWKQYFPEAVNGNSISLYGNNIDISIHVFMIRSSAQFSSIGGVKLTQFPLFS